MSVAFIQLPNNLLGGNFLMSLPTWVDLKKVSSDRPKPGGSEETFSILYQSSGSAETFRRSTGYCGDRSPHPLSAQAIYLLPSHLQLNLPTSRIDKDTSMPVSLLTKVV